MCYLNNIGGSFCKSWQLLFWGEGGQNMAMWEIEYKCFKTYGIYF